MNNDSISKTFIVAISLCIVCSVIVSVSAVHLRTIQEENKALDFKKNILISAGLVGKDDDDKETILDKFKQIETIVVNIDDGQIQKNYNSEDFDRDKMLKDPNQSVEIPDKQDITKIKRRTKVSPIYLIKDGQGIKKLILPVYGKGLWSTMYGFLTLGRDLNTIEGLTFYDDGETPGLGGEINNPRWQSLWKNKQVYDSSFEPKIEVIKGIVKPDSPNAKYQVDGLSGATITSRGVSDMLLYWLGDHGFKTFIRNLKNDRAEDSTDESN